MLLALLSIAAYMTIMWIVYFYRGYLPKTKKRIPREEDIRYDYRPVVAPRDTQANQQQQQPRRPGATMTRSALQQTMIQQQQQQPIPQRPQQKQSPLTRQFINISNQWKLFI